MGKTKRWWALRRLCEGVVEESPGETAERRPFFAVWLPSHTSPLRRRVAESLRHEAGLGDLAVEDADELVSHLELPDQVLAAFARTGPHAGEVCGCAFAITFDRLAIT